MKMRAPCSLVGVDRRFRGAYCLHHHPDYPVVGLEELSKANLNPEPLEYSNETTRRYIPEGSYLHTMRRENLKSHR
jgi:hypothetical protein